MSSPNHHPESEGPRVLRKGSDREHIGGVSLLARQEQLSRGAQESRTKASNVHCRDEELAGKRN